MVTVEKLENKDTGKVFFKIYSQSYYVWIIVEFLSIFTFLREGLDNADWLASDSALPVSQVLGLKAYVMTFGLLVFWGIFSNISIIFHNENKIAEIWKDCC